MGRQVYQFQLGLGYIRVLGQPWYPKMATAITVYTVLCMYSLKVSLRMLTRIFDLLKLSTFILGSVFSYLCFFEIVSYVVQADLISLCSQGGLRNSDSPAFISQNAGSTGAHYHCTLIICFSQNLCILFAFFMLLCFLVVIQNADWSRAIGVSAE